MGIQKPPADFRLPPCEIVPTLPMRVVLPVVLLVPVLMVLLIVTLDHTVSGRNRALHVGGFLLVYIAAGWGWWLVARQRRQRALRRLPSDVIFKGEATLRPLGSHTKRVDHGDLVLDFEGVSFYPRSSTAGTVFKLPWSHVVRMHLWMGRLTIALDNGQNEVIEIPRYWGLAERLRHLPIRGA